MKEPCITTSRNRYTLFTQKHTLGAAYNNHYHQHHHQKCSSHEKEKRGKELAPYKHSQKTAAAKELAILSSHIASRRNFLQAVRANLALRSLYMLLLLLLHSLLLVGSFSSSSWNDHADATCMLGVCLPYYAEAGGKRQAEKAAVKTCFGMRYR